MININYLRKFERDIGYTYNTLNNNNENINYRIKRISRF